VPDLLGGRREQHVAVLLLAAMAEALEHVLVHDAHLALGAANGLLQHAGEDGVGLVDAHGVREVTVMEEHEDLRSVD
jgi:hypothetical protein